MATEAMDDLADRYANRGVTSVFIYTREAHPGEHYRHHSSIQDKRANASAMRRELGMRRRILVDDLGGRVHRAFGTLPNMSWIIGRGGVILYKSSWTAPEDIEDALLWALDHGQRRKQDNLAMVYSERVAWRKNDPEAFRAGLVRAGPQALTDFYNK